MTVYFDGDCPLCRAEIGHYRRCSVPGTVAFVDVAAPTAGLSSSLASDLDREAALARFHVREADGTLVSGAAAFIALWRAVPGWRWIARLAGLPGGPWLLERLYRGFLVVRPALSAVLRRWTPAVAPAARKAPESTVSKSP